MLRRRGLLLLLFFASGASGLIYELVWVRQFGTLFGSSVYSAAVVTAIYMCGLGLGAAFAGRWIDRRFLADPISPLRWYGWFELGIGVLAAAAAMAVPLLAPIAAAASSYEVGAHGWHWLAAGGSIVRYGLAAVLLLPITLLMGGTLTLLIRYVVADDVSNVGWHVGVLYGVNTAGAALGCLVTDTALVPLLGIGATLAIAVGMNGFASAGAFWLARGSRGVAAEAREPLREDGRADEGVAWVAVALALTGFATMAMQIVWFRQLISMFAAFRPVFSILLTVILVGIWLGSLLGGRLVRRMSPTPLYVLALAGFALSALTGLALMQHGASTYGILPSEDVDPFWRWPTLYGRLLRQITWVVGPAALFAGAAFPLGNAIAQRGRDQVGSRAGALYLANTVGGVLGSLVAGFALLPKFGIQTTVTVVMVCVVFALFAILRSAGWRSLAIPARKLVGGASALLVAAVCAWSLLPEQFLLRRSLPLAPESSGEGLIALNEGVNETLAVLYLEGPTIRLLTNGFSMSDTGFESQRYMRSFAHVPLLLGDDIKKVMVMCFGVGNTANAILMYPDVEQVDVVDFSADVLLHSRHFSDSNGRPLEDPRVEVYVNDARHHLHMQEEDTYDLITGEPPPMTHAGVVNLYTREFFELVRSRLRPDGLVTYWLPLWQVGEAAARSMVRAFLDAFPNAVLLSGYRDELVLLGRKGEAPIEIDPERVATRVAAVPGLSDDLRNIALDSPAELVGMLAATTPTLERATEGVAPLRDDHPTLEYAIREVQVSPRIPPDLVSVEDVERWCPRCGSDGLDASDKQRLRGYLDLIRRFYRSDAFLAAKPESPLDPALPLSESEGIALGDSLYLQDLLYVFPPEYKHALQLHRHGRTDLAIASLEQVLRDNPEHPRARRDLAWLRERSAAAGN